MEHEARPATSRGAAARSYRGSDLCASKSANRATGRRVKSISAGQGMASQWWARQQSRTEEDEEDAGNGSSSTSQQIALPFSDTPIIARNREMRKNHRASGGGRRSSLGMRGRRASPPSKTGTPAIPHREVDTAGSSSTLPRGLE